MKKFKEIFYVLLILYLLLSIILVLSSDNLNDRYGLLQINTFLFTWIGIGVVLITTGFIIQVSTNRSNRRRIRKLDDELAKVKIKLYDTGVESEKNTKPLEPLGNTAQDKKGGPSEIQ